MGQPNVTSCNDQVDAAIDAECERVDHQVVQARVHAVHAVGVLHVVHACAVVRIHAALGGIPIDAVTLDYRLDARVSGSAEVDV